MEIAVRGEMVMMRNSRDPRVMVTVTRAEWDAFLAGAKENRFDDV